MWQRQRRERKQREHHAGERPTEDAERESLVHVEPPYPFEGAMTPKTDRPRWSKNRDLAEARSKSFEELPLMGETSDT